MVKCFCEIASSLCRSFVELLLSLKKDVPEALWEEFKSSVQVKFENSFFEKPELKMCHQWRNKITPQPPLFVQYEMIDQMWTLPVLLKVYSVYNQASKIYNPYFRLSSQSSE